MSHGAPPVQAAWCMWLIGPPMTRRSIQPATPASLPCPPPLPRGLGSSDPVLRLGSTLSLTNLTDTRNFVAAARCVAFLNDINDALTKLHRKWLAHPWPPTSATGRGTHKSNAMGILNRNGRNTLYDTNGLSF